MSQPTDASGVPTEIPASALRDIGLHEQITAIDDLQQQRFFPIDKLQAHIDNTPHLAISIFVFSGDKLLLQKRAATKYHSAGLWANTVCSHPRWQESPEDCAYRRLQEELGWQVPLTPFGTIDYAARVGDLYENEHVYCFHGRHRAENQETAFNPVEVDAVAWLSIPEILQQIADRPAAFTEWFRIYMTQYRHMIEQVM